MNFTLTITGEQPSELLSALNSFAQSINPFQAAPASAKERKQTANKAEAELAAITENQPAKTEGSITIEQVRKAVVEKKDLGKSESIKAVLKEFGVPNVTALTSDKYADFLAKIEAL